MKKLFAIVMALVLCISVMSVVVFAAENEITITVVAPEGWAECYAYNWPESLGGWPGTKLTAGADGKYTVTVKAGFDGMVIGEGNGKPQTQDIADLDQTKSEATITIGEAGADGKHSYSIDYGTGTLPPPPPTDYYIAGDEALTGAHWEANSIKMTKGADGIYSYTFKNVAAGEYQLKVTDGTWTNSWGGDGPDGNYVLKVATAGDVTVFFDSASKQISDSQNEAPVTYAYYVAGQAALCGSDWNPKDPANGMTKRADGIYEKVYKDVEPGSYQLKVTDGTWDYCCGHDGPDGNFAFEVKAKGDVVVEFDESKGLVTLVVDGVRIPGTPNPRGSAPGGDVSLVAVSVALLAATAGLVAVVSKKKEF